MEEIIQELEDKFEEFLKNATKTKAFISAHIRSRRNSLELQKLFKKYRKISIEYDKEFKKNKK